MHNVVIAQKCERLNHRGTTQLINDGFRISTNDFAATVRVTKNLIALFPSSIHKKCIKIDYSATESYVFPIVNNLERD